MADKRQYCFNCGEYLGVYEGVRGELEVCTDKECQCEMRNAYAEREAQVRESAAEDNYDRYR